MRLASIAIVLTSAGLLSQCDSGALPESLGVEFALVDGRFYTMDSSAPWAEAVLVSDGRITFVGTTEEVMDRRAPEASVVELDGRLVLPGLHDVHTHPLEARSPIAGTCLLDGQETDPERFVRELRACAPDQRASSWVLGFGHSIFTLLDAQRPPVEILDEAIPDRPAAIMEETSHSVWVNSAGLTAAGITASTPNPPGGVIVKDPATGAPTGILFDSAGDKVFDLAWLPSPETAELNVSGLLEAVSELNANGITSVAEGRTYWRRDFHKAWLEAERQGGLTVRAVLNLWAYPGDTDTEQLAALAALHSSRGDRVRMDQIKVYSDGILINTTAALHAPYQSLLPGIDALTGLNYFTEDRLTAYLQALPQFDFHIHAIGDRGVHEALNAVERAGRLDHRHRITHLEIVDPADYARFAELNVTADMQVAGAFTQPSAWQDNEPLVGERAHPFVPLRSLHEAGARITLSSDWDVSTLNPFVGMQNALTRDPQALPSVHDAVMAYTLNAAYALGQEDLTGSVEVGKAADFVVVDRNIFEIPIDQISRTRVDLTVFDGTVVYRR
ncbi:MAG: amidohydrolase [Rhodothermales bacterium]|nr:amidohydrolase [Rhodothermales bacterium]MBO6779172.1 amidohydrolase [Rhodothermales bacterium]